jgi:hypothetical protein
MKKALLGTFVTLLVMAALVSCDDVIGGLGGEKAEYTPDGKRLVEVSIVNNMGRSITNQFAKDAANYMEVIFKDGGTYYQASGFMALPLKIKIPAKTYPTTDAILLLGRSNDKTLLATGMLSAAANATVPNPTFTFAVVAVGVDLRAGVASSFAIDESTVTAFLGKTMNGKYSGETCFQVPLNITTVGASLTFSGFELPDPPSTAPASGPNVFMSGISKITFTEIQTGLPTIGPITTVSPLTGATLGTTGKVGFSFPTTTAGVYAVYFEIGVVGFATTGVPDAIKWNLRGGTADGLDLGLTQTKAEGVVIVVTSNPDGETEGTINPPVIPTGP